MNGCAGLILNAVRATGHHVVVGGCYLTKPRIGEDPMRSVCAQLWDDGELVNLGPPRDLAFWQEYPEASQAMECGITDALAPQYDEDDPWPGILDGEHGDFLDDDDFEF